jgi:molybdopterin-guanine dinucleotide biosynthesis protein MobB
LAALVSWFAAQGLRVAVVNVSPELEVGDTGKDTGKFRQAGANPVVLAAPGVCQITYVIPENQDFALKQALAALTPSADLILIDGPARGLLPKVILMEAGSSPQLSDSHEIIALLSPEPRAAPTPVFQPDQIPELGRHILNCLRE